MSAHRVGTDEVPPASRRAGAGAVRRRIELTTGALPQTPLLNGWARVIAIGAVLAIATGSALAQPDPWGTGSGAGSGSNSGGTGIGGSGNGGNGVGGNGGPGIGGSGGNGGNGGNGNGIGQGSGAGGSNGNGTGIGGNGGNGGNGGSGNGGNGGPGIGGNGVGGGGSNAGSAGSNGSAAGSNSAGGGSNLYPGMPGGGSGAGSGSAKAPKIIIQIPPDVVAPIVSASASPSTMRLGQAFTLFVEAAYGNGVEVNLREPIELGYEFEVVKKVSVADRIRPDGLKVREWQLSVIAWELGDLQVPEMGVTFTVSGKAGQVATNAVPLKVLGVLGDVDDPKLMRASSAPVRLISRDWFWLYVGGSAAAAILLTWVFFWIRGRRRGKNIAMSGGVITVARRIDMTSERALERLLVLERSGALADDDRRKGGYEEMARVIREYLGMRYRVATLDLTSTELMRALARVAPADEIAAIERFLERADYVKYAGAKSTTTAATGILNDARELIISTATLRDGTSASQRMRAFKSELGVPHSANDEDAA